MGRIQLTYIGADYPFTSITSRTSQKDYHLMLRVNIFGNTPTRTFIHVFVRPELIAQEEIRDSGCLGWMTGLLYYKDHIIVHGHDILISRNLRLLMNEPCNHDDFMGIGVVAIEH